MLKYKIKKNKWGDSVAKYKNVQEFLDDKVLIDKLKALSNLHTNKIQLVHLDEDYIDGFYVWSMDKECVEIIPNKDWHSDYLLKLNEKGSVLKNKVKKISDLLYVSTTVL